jgi:hypothetical protein
VPAPPPRDAGRRPGAAPLAAYVPGVTTLTARCPFAREVELGIDTTGAIHLFAKVEDPKNDAGPVKSLLVAATWLAEHAGLIGLTLPDGASLNPDSKPISHLLVEDPRAVARLLRTGLRVHLLTKGQAAEIG